MNGNNYLFLRLEHRLPIWYQSSPLFYLSCRFVSVPKMNIFLLLTDIYSVGNQAYHF